MGGGVRLRIKDPSHAFQVAGPPCRGGQNVCRNFGTVWPPTHPSLHQLLHSMSVPFMGLIFLSDG